MHVTLTDHFLSILLVSGNHTTATSPIWKANTQGHGAEKTETNTRLCCFWQDSGFNSIHMQAMSQSGRVGIYGLQHPQSLNAHVVNNCSSTGYNRNLKKTLPAQLLCWYAATND